MYKANTKHVISQIEKNFPSRIIKLSDWKVVVKILSIKELNKFKRMQTFSWHSHYTEQVMLTQDTTLT